MKFTFYGGAGSVTGVNIMLSSEKENGAKILFDCGLVQGEKIGDPKNHEPFSYDLKTVDALFISHAHIDHTGRIPKLVKDGYRGPIYSTAPTKDIARLLLSDSLGILAKESERDHLPLIYNEADVEKAFSQWRTLDYHQPVTIKDFVVNFRDAGHVLGSAMTEVSHDGKKVLFTGDLGNSPAPFLPDTEIVKDVDYLLVESVYGDRNHEHREDRKKILAQVIQETMRQKGTLVIPTFSFERTQELLFEIRNMMSLSSIPLVPVYLDSPLAIKITDVYRHYMDFYKQTLKKSFVIGDDIFGFPQLQQTLSTEESKGIFSHKGPKIVIAGSGMSNGGRIVHHEKNYLPDPNNTLLILGYQAPGTLGRRIQDGNKTVHILGAEVPVRAKIVSIGGYSAHKDSDHLLQFVSDSADSLKKVFVVLGEPKSSLFLVQKIRDYLGISAVMPRDQESIII